MGIDEVLQWLVRFAPGQGGAIWLFLLVALILFGDFKRLASRRNLVLVLLLVPAVPLVDILRWESYLGDPDRGWILGAVFLALYVATAFMAAWALVLALGRPRSKVTPNVTSPQARLLLAFVLVMNVFVVLTRAPDDCGIYTNLGAQRWMETGTVAYGDPLLRGPDAPAFGAAATYGPLLFAAHMPFQLITTTHWNAADADPSDTTYVRAPLLATKLCSLAFHLLGLWALLGIGNRLCGPPTGMALATLYAVSPYVVGLGGDRWVIGGLAFISHLAPVAMILLTLRFMHRPVVAGIMLAAGAGVLFYPAFLFPLFLGWYFWRKEGGLAFTLGFAVTGAAIAALVITFTGSIGDDGPIRLFLESTFEHQEGVGAKEYGASKFSFWGTHPALAEFWQTPLSGTTSLLKPTFLLFVALCLGAFFMARGRTLPQLALLVAFLSAAIQLWKTHAAGTYVEWYFPFLLIGLLAAGPPRSEIEPPDVQPEA